MNCRVILIFLFLIAFMQGCNSGTTVPFPDDFQQRVTSAFQQSLSDNGFPGGVLGIIRLSDEATMYVAAGMAQADDITNGDQSLWDTKTPMTTNMKFRIASITKPFTATMILMLVKQGRLSLDQTIDDFFLNLVPNSSTITIRNLLSMTSGLYDHENSPFMDEYTTCGSLTEYFTPEELIGYSNDFSGGTVYFEPGTFYNYCNTNYTILAMIAQRATGKTYKQLITDMIINYLGLRGTSVPGDDDTSMPSPNAHGYYTCDTTNLWRDYSVQNMSWDLAAGNIISTASDLLRMMEAIYTGELIGAELKDEMFTPPSVNNAETGAPSSYGLGIEITPDAVHHEGANPGYNGIMAYYKGYYISILLNAGVYASLNGEQLTTTVSNVFADVYTAIAQ
ncbi:MAG: serine hydrolase domain-containing protein [Pseudomonadota bacterium]